MVRPVTDQDIGLKVLCDQPADTADIDIVAIHGIGAHPDDTWCKRVGPAESPQRVNWLQAEDMLPAIAPHARIMRYGYQSEWFGEGAMRQNASTVAQRLLLALRRKREEYPHRPLLFIAHCFGGLVVLKALIDARHDESEWAGIFASTTGLIFLGTPFRGAEGMSQVEMLAAAQREYQQDEIQPEVLKILEPGNEFLQEVVDQFGKMRKQANKAQVACFYELKTSNVGRIVGKSDRTRFVVSESSGCLDLSDATSKFSLSRTHFDMNKFREPAEEDFETMRDVVKDMIRASPRLMAARSQIMQNGSPYYIKQGGLSAPGVSKHKIDFSLRGVPVVNQFVARDAEMQALEKALVKTSLTTGRRNVVVVHGLGGIGKTQLVVEFARKHQNRFSAVFWLDGSSEASLKQSFVDMAQRLPRAELTADSVHMLSQAIVEADVAVRECQQWLSISSNSHWLLIIDNVDRDCHDQNDVQAYEVKNYFPHADHGSILITSRLASLQRLGSGVKVVTVAVEQARTILENNAGRIVEDAEVVLQLLHGLPLAITQAGSYMRETNMSASTYAKYYNSTWGRLMEKQQKRFPLQEYGDRSVLTTWTMSYEQVQKQSKEAACLIKLWGFLYNGELWYELIAADVDLGTGTDVPEWLLEIAEDELSFADAMGLLSRYSLVEGKEGTESYSMHSVLHRWCGHLVEKEERCELGCLAVGLVAGLVASSVPLVSEAEFWRKRKRIIAHALCVSEWIVSNSISGEEGAVKGLIQPRLFRNLGHLLSDEDRQRAEQMYQRALAGYEKAWGPDHTTTLITVNSLGNLYADLGKLEQAEQMYKRAMAGCEKAWGPDHTKTLSTVHNLGKLYADLGKVEKAEQMLQRALIGRERALGPDHTKTLSTVNNLGVLYADLGKLEQAEQMYKRALAGREKVWGPNHTKTLSIVNNLGSLYLDLGKLEQAEQMYQRALAGYENALWPGHTETLDMVNNLGVLYDVLGKLEQAEYMYQRALAGYEKAWGPDHTSTLDTVKNLGNLYADLGKLEEAEQMYQRALDGYARAISPENRLTFIPALNNMWGLASLRKRQGRIEDARYWYLQALLGYEKTFGQEHDKCQALRDNLEALTTDEEEEERGDLDTSTNRSLVVDHTSMQSEVDPGTSAAKPASKRRLLRKLRWK